MKDLEADIAAFQREMAKLKGEKIMPKAMLRGAEILKAWAETLKLTTLKLQKKLKSTIQ